MDTSKSLARRSTRLCFRTLTVGLLAGALSLPSASVLAAAPTSAPPAEPAVTAETNPAVTKSRALFEQGLAAYEASDYESASHYWTEAHDLMRQTPELSASRRVLGFDLAQAQMRAHARDRHKSRMEAAKPLLEEFIAWVDRPGHTMDEGEKQDRTRAVELLEQIESESVPPAPVPAPAPQVSLPPPTPTQPPPPPAAPGPNGTRLLIGGGLALGGGLASIAAVFAIKPRALAAENKYTAASQDIADATTELGREVAQSDLEEAEEDGRRANTGLLTFVSTSVLLTTAGITMLAIGGHRRRRHISASAALTPRFVGASLSARF